MFPRFTDKKGQSWPKSPGLLVSSLFIYAFLVCHADMLILSLSILHPLSLVQQGAEEVGSGTELPCSKDVTQRKEPLTWTVTMLCDLGQVTLSD